MSDHKPCPFCGSTLDKAITMLEREIRRVQKIRMDLKPPHKVDLKHVQEEYELMLAELTETDK